MNKYRNKEHNRRKKVNRNIQIEVGTGRNVGEMEGKIEQTKQVKKDKNEKK